MCVEMNLPCEKSMVTKFLGSYLCPCKPLQHDKVKIPVGASLSLYVKYLWIEFACIL